MGNDISTGTKTRSIIRDIEDLCGDTSVPPETTLEALEELASLVDGMIDGIKADLKRAKS